ncbi:unnamed protein product [[Candida] boidinii]|uniref:Unnamed protein product n=1 Tax=Candida boidinii TaxID=5477 RepID=A0A9W6WFZ1_CANBO|nr:unnamed protein product [[Candida] boidinii]
MQSFLTTSHSQLSHYNSNYNSSQLSTGNISSPTMMPQYQLQNQDQSGASQASYTPSQQQQQQPYYVLEDGSSVYNRSVTYGNLNSTGNNLNLMDSNSTYQQQFKPKTFSNIYGNTAFDTQYHPSVGQLQQQQLSQAQVQQLRHQDSASYHLQQAASSNAYALMDAKKKRKRRKFHEIDRLYKCNFQNCDKSYGTLNHLNAHVQLQVHGEKRLPSEFKQIREQCKAKKKQMKIEAELNRNKLYQSQSIFGNISAPIHSATSNGYYPVFPPASSIEPATGAPLHSTYSDVQTATHGSTVYPGSGLSYSSGLPLWTKSKPSSAPNILQPEDVTQQQSTPNSIISLQQQSPYISSVDPYAAYPKKNLQGSITDPKTSKTFGAYSGGLVGSSMSNSYVANPSTSTLGYK